MCPEIELCLRCNFHNNKNISVIHIPTLLERNNLQNSILGTQMTHLLLAEFEVAVAISCFLLVISEWSFVLFLKTHPTPSGNI